MENISKTLIMISAVLGALLIIGMSVLAFNILKDPVAKTVDSMNSEERIFFNTKFQRYEGDRVAGLEVKALANIALQNSTFQLSMEERARIPEMFITYNQGPDITFTRSDINGTNNPETYKNKFQDILNRIKNTSFFSVKTELNAKNGIVSKITIKEL